MHGWLEPMGPEPAQTYWIRRGIVALVMVALIASVGWLSSRPRAALDVAAAAASSPSTPTESGPPTGTHRPTGTPAASPADSESADPSGSPTPSPDETVSPEASAEPTPSQSPTPAQQSPASCRPQSLAMRIEGPNAVSAAAPAIFKIVVTTTQPECLLDLANAAAGVVVTSGSDRIWASGDCPDWQPSGTLELAKGEEAAFEVGWPVRRSNGCELVETSLGSGTYVATATIAPASARHVMQVQP